MILAINTAFIAANLALSTEDEKTHLKDLNAECKHSENVLKKIDELALLLERHLVVSAKMQNLFLCHLWNLWHI